MACTAESFCVSMSVRVEQNEFGADPAWVAGAFFLGLILGAALTALCVRPVLREWEKKKRQDIEKGKYTIGSVPVSTKVVSKKDSMPEEKKKSKKKKGGKFKKLKDEDDEDDIDDYRDKVQDKFPELIKGMVDVMVQSDSNGAEVEIASQDLETVTSYEDRQRKEKQKLQVQLLAILLRKHLEKRKITTPFYDGFIHKTRIEMADIDKVAEREKNEKEEELRDDMKLSKNSEALETELQKVQTDYNNKLNQLDKDYWDKIRQDLMRSSGLTDIEVDVLMDKLNNELAEFESKKALEQARQRRSLEDRLAKRKQFVEYRTMMEEETQNDVDAQVDGYDDLLSKYVEDGKLVERQKDELLKQYQHDLQDLNQRWEKDAARQQLQLAEKLRLRRMKRCHKLAVKQSKEEAILIQTADKSISTNTDEYLKVYNDLIVKHHSEQEELGSELDQSEIKEIETLKQESNKSLSEAIAREEEKMAEKISDTAKMTRKEGEKVLLFHRKQQELYNLKKQHERQAAIARLQQKLNQRMMKLEEEEELDRLEGHQLQEQQMNTMEKVLTSNIELDQEARQKVLDQHKQNMEALNNQLQQSKLRQMKSLEYKLSQRRAKLSELQKKQADLRHHTRDINSKEREKIQTKLDIEIAEEEKRLEEHRQKALDNLKQQLTEETQKALLVQEEEMGKLIGRLQVGQARRKAILQKQDKTLQELQEQLEKKVTEEGELPKTMADQLLMQHRNQVHHLNQQIQRSRDNQEQSLIEKIQVKKRKKERELQEQMEEEVEEEYQVQKLHGKGFARHVLMQTFLEQKHRKMMNDLEMEMKSELEKNKENMNNDMELELQKELEGQKQQLLTQLAAISNLSSGEIQDVVDTAVLDTGESDQTAKKLAKDLRQEIKRAKTSLGVEENEEDDRYNRPRSSLQYGSASDLQPIRNTKPRLKRPTPQPTKSYFDEGFDESEDDYNGF